MKRFHIPQPASAIKCTLLTVAISVGLMPDVWTKLKIDVRGERAHLYVHSQQQPTLIVNDLKTGALGRAASRSSSIAELFAHFRSLRVKPLSISMK